MTVEVIIDSTDWVVVLNWKTLAVDFISHQFLSITIRCELQHSNVFLCVKPNFWITAYTQYRI